MREEFEAYEEVGVREYLIINPLDKNVIIYKLNTEGIFIGLKPYIETDTMPSAIFPDLKIHLPDIFEDL